MLLSSPVTCSHLGIFASVKEFLMQLLSTRTGLLYLCSRPEQTNGIIRALTQVNIFNGMRSCAIHMIWLWE